MVIDIAKKIAQLIDNNAIGKAIAQVWDLKGLSKDLAVALTDRVAKQKDVLVDAMAKEFSAFLQKINISEESQKILEGMELNIQGSIEFTKKKPKAKVSKKKKQTKKKKKS